MSLSLLLPKNPKRARNTYSQHNSCTLNLVQLSQSIKTQHKPKFPHQKLPKVPTKFVKQLPPNPKKQQKFPKVNTMFQPMKLLQWKKRKIPYMHPLFGPLIPGKPKKFLQWQKRTQKTQGRPQPVFQKMVVPL